MNTNPLRTAVLLLVLIVPAVLASPYDYPGDPSPDRFLTNTQHYSVIFDGEGEAEVVAKLSLNNLPPEPLYGFSVEIPGTSVRIISIMQEAEAYDDWRYDPYGSGDGVRYGPEYYPAQYYPVLYTQETLSHSTMLRFELPVPVEQNERATILLYYKAGDYAKKSLGVWKADFETIRMGVDTHHIRVAVNALPDFKLKGSTTAVDYQSAFSLAISAKEAAPIGGAPASTLSKLSDRVEHVSGLVKETQSLDPWESFHVTAAYASSSLLLYKWRILIIIAVVTLIFAALATLAVRFAAQMKCYGSSHTSAQRKDTLSRPLKRSYPAQAAKSAALTKALLVSFVSAVLVYFVYFGAVGVLWYAARVSSYHDGYAGLMFVLLPLFVGLAMLGLVFAPALYLGLREGAGMGLFAFGATLFWLLLFGGIIMFLWSALPMPDHYLSAMVGGAYA